MSTVITTNTIYQDARQSLRIALPLIVTYLVQAASSFVGTIMISRLGQQALAASALVSSIYITILVFQFGLLSAVSVLVAQNYGAKNKDGIHKTIVNGFWVSIMISVPTIILIAFSHTILKLSGQSLPVIHYATRYLFALGWGILPLSFLIVMEQFLIGMNKTRLVLIVSLIEAPLEIFFSYALIFGKFGFPKCGIAGLGYGFSMVFVIVAVILGLITAYQKHCRPYRIYSDWLDVDWSYIWELFRIGAPVGVMYIVEVVLYTIIAFMMGWISMAALAAHQIALQFGNFTFMVVAAISQAITINVGHAVGRLDQQGVKRAAFVGTWIGVIISVLIGSCYLLFPKTLMAIDINIYDPKNQALIHFAVIFMGILAFTQLFDNIRLSMFGALRGLKDTKIPLYVSILAYWFIALPAAYVLGFYTPLRGAGLWVGLTIGVGVGAIILIYRFNKLFANLDLKNILAVEFRQ